MWKRIKATCLLLITTFSLALPVHALDDVEIVGSYSDKFSLTSSQGELFELPLMAPGDEWENDLKVKNQTGVKMEVRLVEVKNEIEDSMIYDILETKIHKGDELYYEGRYNQIPASDWFVLEDGKTMNFQVEISFPGKYGNEYQGKDFQSEWVLESRLPDGVKPPKDDKENVQTGVIRTFYFAMGVFGISSLLYFLLNKKKEEEKQKEEEVEEN